VGATHAMNPTPGSTPAPAPAPAYEGQIAGDLARRVLIVAPVVLLVAGIVGGVDGLISAAIGLVLVALNFLASARLITWAAGIGPNAVMGLVLGGYIVRLAVLFGIAFALDTVSWIDIGVLLLTIAVVHIALLTWETRHVSLTLGYPGLKPGRQ
jgi:hypothetical protein